MRADLGYIDTSECLDWRRHRRKEATHFRCRTIITQQHNLIGLWQRSRHLSCDLQTTTHRDSTVYYRPYQTKTINNCQIPPVLQYKFNFNHIKHDGLSLWLVRQYGNHHLTFCAILSLAETALNVYSRRTCLHVLKHPAN